MAPGLAGVVLMALDLAERVSLLAALNPMALLAAPDPAERVSLLTALNPTEIVGHLMALDLTPTAFLTPDLTEAVLPVNLVESMAFFAAPDLTEAVLNLTESMAIAALDPTMPVKVGPAPDEGDDKMRLVRPNYHVGAADWCRVTGTSLETSSPSDNEGCTSSSPSNKSNNNLKSRYPLVSRSNGSGNQRILSAQGSAQEAHLNLRPMTSRYVLTAVGRLAKSESCPGLSTPLACSVEEKHLNPLATLGHAASDSALTGSQSVTTLGSAAHPSCLLMLSSSTTYPMDSNASVTQLPHPRLHPPHRRALHVSPVLIQGPRVRS